MSDEYLNGPGGHVSPDLALPARTERAIRRSEASAGTQQAHLAFHRHRAHQQDIPTRIGRRGQGGARWIPYARVETVSNRIPRPRPRKPEWSPAAACTAGKNALPPLQRDMHDGMSKSGTSCGSRYTGDHRTRHARSAETVSPRAVGRTVRKLRMARVDLLPPAWYVRS